MLQKCHTFLEYIEDISVNLCFKYSDLQRKTL